MKLFRTDRNNGVPPAADLIRCVGGKTVTKTVITTDESFLPRQYQGLESQCLASLKLFVSPVRAGLFEESLRFLKIAALLPNAVPSRGILELLCRVSSDRGARVLAEKYFGKIYIVAADVEARLQLYRKTYQSYNALFVERPPVSVWLPPHRLAIWQNEIVEIEQSLKSHPQTFPATSAVQVT